MIIPATTVCTRKCLSLQRTSWLLTYHVSPQYDETVSGTVRCLNISPDAPCSLDTKQFWSDTPCWFHPSSRTTLNCAGHDDSQQADAKELAICTKIHRSLSLLLYPGSITPDLLSDPETRRLRLRIWGRCVDQRLGFTVHKVNRRLSTRFKKLTYSWKVKLSVDVSQRRKGGEHSISQPARLTTGERLCGTHWMGDWVHSRVGLDVSKNREEFTLAGNGTNIPQTPSP